MAISGSSASSHRSPIILKKLRRSGSKVDTLAEGGNGAGSNSGGGGIGAAGGKVARVADVAAAVDRATAGDCDGVAKPVSWMGRSPQSDWADAVSPRMQSHKRHHIGQRQHCKRNCTIMPLVRSHRILVGAHHRFVIAQGRINCLIGSNGLNVRIGACFLLRRNVAHAT